MLRVGERTDFVCVSRAASGGLSGLPPHERQELEQQDQRQVTEERGLDRLWITVQRSERLLFAHAVAASNHVALLVTEVRLVLEADATNLAHMSRRTL